MPSTNSGMARPRLVYTRVALSARLPARIPDTRPSGIPTINATKVPAMTRPTVTGRRWEISCATSSCETRDVPRSPCTALLSQSQYCPSSGLLRPRSSRICSTCFGVASIPASWSAWSPGTSDTSQNTPKVTINRIGMTESSRLAIRAPKVPSHPPRIDPER